MRYRTGFVVLFAIAGAQACGGASANDFSTPAGGKSAGGTGATAETGGSGDATSSGGTKSSGGTSGTGGGSATGGSDSTGGTTDTGGADTTGGTSGTGGDAVGGTGADTTGGTGGDAVGGTGAGGTGGDAVGGTSGASAMGGTAAGMTGGSAGMTGGRGGSAGSGMNPDCAALEMDYSMTLQQAEACNPDSGKDQCTAMEKNDLTCPNCSVYVNPDNQAAIMHLAELRKQAGNHCVTPCPAIACVMPESATCGPVAGSRSAGRCTSSPLPL